MITVATWNINSIKARLEAVQDWLGRHQPDVLMLQEIKCTNETFPKEAFESLGYFVHVHGQPAYHGVATLTRMPAELVTTQLLDDDTHPRFMDVAYHGLRLINIYAPNGNPLGTEKFEYKLRWLQRLYEYLQDLRRQRIPFMIAGDYNIIPTAHDARHPEQWMNDALYQPESRAMWQRLLALGLTDAYRALHPHDTDAYTFWDYQAGAWQRNNGIRIDHALLSPTLTDRLEKCWIDRTPRDGERPSDHTPLIVEIS